MDKSQGSLTIKFSGKESLDLNVLSKLCSCLVNVLNKISLISLKSKNEYSVNYNVGDSFSLTVVQEHNENSIIDNNINVFNTFIDLLSLRRFIALKKNFSIVREDEIVHVNNGEDIEDYIASSYDIYIFDNYIEDCLAKLSSIILSKKNSFQVLYKNGILEKRITYSKEDLENTSKKINLELAYSKEEYKTKMALEVAQLDLLSTSNWKFKDLVNKSSTFKAKITDKEFTKQLKSGNIVLGYGLILKGDVKTVVFKDHLGKVIPNKSTYYLEKVDDVLYSNQVDITTLNLD